MDTPGSLLEQVSRRPDARSWRRLVDLYTPFLEHVVASQGLSGPDADDLIQDVFTVLMDELPQFQHSGRTGAFRHWLRQIVLNRLRRHWRSKSLQNRFQEVQANLTDPLDPLQRIWDAEHNRWITNRLMELVEPEFSQTTWRAFYLQVVESCAPRDVALRLGISVNAALIAKSRVLRRMRLEIAGLTD